MLFDDFRNNIKKSKMKKIFILTALFFVSIIGNAQVLKAELTATGLTCSMCSKATYKQLISIAEVDKVEPDLNNTAFVIYFKSGSAANISDIKNKVEDAGFSVGQLVVTLNLNNQAVNNNSSFELNNSKYTVMETKPATLNGEVKVKILDKGYIVEKEYKQIAKLVTKYPTYASNSKNLYHIKVL